MHHRNVYKYFFVLLLFFSYLYKVSGQDINNMQIGVSALAITVLKFNSSISHCELRNYDHYVFQITNDKILRLKTKGDVGDTTYLFINEGRRAHLFTIVFLPTLDFNHTRLWYDFSNLKELKKLVDDLNQREITDIIPIQRGSSDNIVPHHLASASYEDTLAHQIKDSFAEKPTVVKSKNKRDKKTSKNKPDSLTAQKAETVKFDTALIEKNVIALTQTQGLENEIFPKPKIDSPKAQIANGKNITPIKTIPETVQNLKTTAVVIKPKVLKNNKLISAKPDSIKVPTLETKKTDFAQSQKDETDGIITERKRKITDSLTRTSKFYNHVELWRKYGPSFNFEAPPEGQFLAGDYFIDRDTMENARVSYLILEDTPRMQQSSNMFNNVNFTLQGIYFSGTNCYMRILIQNRSKNDYLVGPINLSWHTDSGRSYDAYPCFITSYPSQGIRTSFPVLAPGVDETIVLTTRALNVKKNDYLKLTMGDRLDKIYLELTIPEKEYNVIMEQIK